VIDTLDVVDGVVGVDVLVAGTIGVSELVY